MHGIGKLSDIVNCDTLKHIPFCAIRCKRLASGRSNCHVENQVKFPHHLGASIIMILIPKMKKKYLIHWTSPITTSVIDEFATINNTIVN